MSEIPHAPRDLARPGGRWLDVLRATPGGGALIVALVAAAVGLLTTFPMPRGPVSAAGGLAVMASGLVLGLVSAFAWRSRWAAPLAFIAYVAAFEAGRRGVVGPTVDTIRLDNTFGILALLLGRGVHYLLVLLPLVAGAGLGRAISERLRDRTTPDREGGRRSLALVVVRRAPTAVALVLTAALALLVALPARTPPVLGADGQPIPGSLAELTTVRLGGVEQSVMIRAADPAKPVLLYLSGGPGQSDLALSRVLAEGWTRDFVFVDWDQRGNGKSYGALDPVETYTLDRAVADTIELTEYLRTRFDQPKVYLMGESWGTILGVLAVQRRPDLYFAWIGSGQMVDVRETDQRIYRDLQAYAAEHGDGALEAQLARIGAPPYADLPWSNAFVMTMYDYLYRPYTPSDGYRARGEASGLDDFGLLGSEYDLIEKTNVVRGLIDTFAVMYPQIQGVDFRRDVPRLEVPVYLLDGAAELAGRRDLAIEWFDRLSAPYKQRITFENAAHSVAFEQADDVQRLLVDTIVPATYRT